MLMSLIYEDSYYDLPTAAIYPAAAPHVLSANLRRSGQQRFEASLALFQLNSILRNTVDT